MAETIVNSRVKRAQRARYVRAAVEILEHRVMLSGAALQTIYSFSGAGGVGPTGDVVIDNAGNLYGMNNGGTYGQGSLWELEAGGSTFHTLASLNNNGMWETLPGQLTDSSRNTPGSPIASSYTYGGGVTQEIVQLRGDLAKSVVDSYGNVFRIENFSNTMGIVETRPTTNNGAVYLPAQISLNGTTVITCAGGLTLDRHDNVYGVTPYGGVFEIQAGGTNAAMLASFGSANGIGQSGLTIDAAGNLYGITSAGGSSTSGEIYEVAAGSGHVTNLMSFDGTNGPVYGNLTVDSDGNLFGTMSGGGTGGGAGTVFELAAGTHALTTLITFHGNDGANPKGGLTLDSSENLYGTTFGEGSANPGTIFKVTLGPRLKFDATPSNVAPGQPAQPIKIDVTGTAGLIDTTSSANITLNVLAPDGITVMQTATATAQNGVATFPTMSSPTPGPYTLQVTSDGFAAASKSITVGPGPATQLVFLNPRTNIAPGGSLGKITVAVEDAFGNIVTSDQSNIALTIKAVPSAASTVHPNVISPMGELNLGGGSIFTGGTGTFTGGTTVFPISARAVNGVATLDESTFSTVGSFELDASILPPAGATTSTPPLTSSTIVNIKSWATHLSFYSLQPASNAVNGSIKCIVGLFDDQGKLVTNDTSTITLALSGSANGSLHGPISLSVGNGYVYFPYLSVDQAGVYSIVASDGTLTAATSSPFTVTPTPTHLTFLTAPTSGTPGEALGNITVAVEDDHGNIVTNYLGSVQLHAQPIINSYSNNLTLNGNTSVVIQNGMATFSNLSLAEEIYTLDASFNSGQMKTTSYNLTIGAPSPPQLDFGTLFDAPLQPGLQMNVVVYIRDGLGVETRNQSQVTLSLIGQSGSVVQTYTVAAANGIAIFNAVTFPAAGQYTFQASGGGMAPATASNISIAVTGPAFKTVFITQPTDITSGSHLGTVTVAVEDQFGNVVTDDNSTINITLSTAELTHPLLNAASPGQIIPSNILLGLNDGQITGTLSAATHNGVATFTDLSVKADGHCNLESHDGFLNFGQSETFLVSPPVGSVSHLEFSQPVDAYVAGEGLYPLSVSIVDESGFVERQAQSSATITVVNDAGTTLSTYIVPITGGSATLYGITIPTAGTYTLTATAIGMPPAHPVTIKVAQRGVPLKIVFLNQPANATSNGSIGTITAAIEDVAGNIVTSDDSLVTAGLSVESFILTGSQPYDSSNPIITIPQLTGTLTQRAINGVVTFTDLSVVGAGTFYLTASDGSLSTRNSNTFTVTAALGSPTPVTPSPVTPAPPIIPSPPVTSEPASLPALTVLANFNGSGSADGLILDANGNLYGTTITGGAHADGTIFEIIAGTKTVTTLATFAGTNGAQPMGGLMIDAKGNLYGTTSAGGSAGDGTIYMLAKGSRTVSTLASFHGKDGHDPRATLVMDHAGNLFGTTLTGGANNMGTVFELAKRSRHPRVLVSFGGTNGAAPAAGLTMDAQGNLYGMTTGSGAVVFELSKRNHALTKLATLGQSIAYSPRGPMVMDAKGNLFGVLNNGGTNGTGVVFELATGSRKATLVASFDLTSGSPDGGLLIDPSGNLFGTYSHDANSNRYGGIFEIAAGSTTITRLAACDGAVTGNYPRGALTMDKNGTLYGTAYLGLPQDTGTVFSFVPSRSHS